jgi:hypothetical protein
MTTPRRIVLTLSPDLYARLKARATEGRPFQGPLISVDGETVRW